MYRQILLILMTFALVELSYRQVEAQQMSTKIVAGEQLLVLNNGNIVPGFIEQKTDHHVVQTRQGSRLVIANDQTLFICDSLQQAYWGKLAHIRASDVEGQLAIFHWCSRHQLWAEAKNQLEVLQTLQVEPRRLEYLQRQLQLASAPRAQPDIPPAQFPAMDSKLATTPTDAQDGLVTIDTVFSPLPSLNPDMADQAFAGSIVDSTQKTNQTSGFGPSNKVIQVGYAEPASTTDWPVDDESMPKTISRPDSILGGPMATPGGGPNETVALANTRSLQNRVPANSWPKMEEPARFVESKSIRAKPINSADSKSMPMQNLPGLPPLVSTIGEIPQLGSRPVSFKPRDEFDPEIFNRKYVDRID